MGFTEPIFIFLFLPCFLLFYFGSYALEKRFAGFGRLRIREIILCLFSLLFYSFFNLYYLSWISAMVVLTFLGGLWVDRSKRKKPALATTVGTLIAVLGFFKYAAYYSGVWFGETAFGRLSAPLGISFIIFSAVSYLVDIYRGDAPAGDLLDAAVFLTFFPKVISGPIVLWKEFDGKIKNARPNTELFFNGINRVCIGFAKKTILADIFGSFVNEVLQNMNVGIDTASAWIMMLFFFFEIYFDFSGYSDIAVGISGIVGVEIGENFRFPYLATSVTDFWKRWHISLGNWFKEYVYIPLGGNRRSKPRTALNLFIVFLITGIWHGAGLLYLLWGCMHGIIRVAEYLLHGSKLYQRIPAVIKWAFTTFAVMIGWMAFCFRSPEEIIRFFGTLFGISVSEKVGITALYFCNIKAISVTVIALLGSLLFGAPPLKRLVNKLRGSAAGLAITEVFVLGLFVLALIFMINSTYSPFLYFQY